MIRMIAAFLIFSAAWFVSTLPFLIPYQILLNAQCKKIECKLPILHIAAAAVFVFYLTGVMNFTGIPTILRDIVHNSYGIITPHGLSIQQEEINLIPFRWIAEDARPYIENILLFIPLGFMLPFLWKRYEVLWKTALSGFSLSLFIELIQLFNRNRVTDIDDLLMNTLGAFIGWAIFRMLKEHLSKLREKVALQCTDIEKIPVLLREEACFYLAGAFAGMFFVYNPLLIYPFLKSLFG